MKRILGFIVLCFFIINLSSDLLAQERRIPPSLRANVTQRLGLETDITFDFSRPGVKGRKIYGDLVPYGFAPGNKYSDDKPFPWRAGANKNSTIEFNTDLIIEGNRLAAGKYGIHMIPSKTTWIVIFSKNNELWGSYEYNKDEDALRITVTPVKAPHCEWLTFGFEELAGTSAVAYLHWEKLKIPFKIELAGTDQ